MLETTLTTLPVLAHIAPYAHQHGSGFAAGLIHPLSGLDHLLAMLAVGLWAAQLGGKAKWALPASFVAFMLVGGGLVWAGLAMPTPIIESGVLVSVFVLGLLVVWAGRLPLAVGLCLTALFAVFHGSAHAAETPASSLAAFYALGFVLATTTLHATGLGLGMVLADQHKGWWVRACGSAVAALALMLSVGLIGA